MAGKQIVDHKKRNAEIKHHPLTITKNNKRGIL
jgi:hypothetical protein